MMANEEIADIRRRLEEHEKRILQLETMAGEEKKEEGYERGKPEKHVKRLAEKVSMSVEDINKIFDVEEEGLTLTSVIGKDDKENTINVTLLVLLAYKYFFGMDDVLSQEIRRNIAENRVALGSFSHYLKAIRPSLVRRKGKASSPKTTYRLTTLGEAEAREVLKRHVNET